MEWLKWIVGAGIALGSFILGLSKNSRDNKRETVQEAAAGATLKRDVVYIKKRVDEIWNDQRDHGEQLNKLSTDVVKAKDLADRARDCADSAHHRLDRIDIVLNGHKS